MTKNEQLLLLAQKRKKTKYEGYKAIGDYNNGAYECNYISPYSISAHNENADILIILQDWCSEKGFGAEICNETLKYGYTPDVRTNINLKKLIQEHFQIELEQTYATNLFPYIKPGAMSAYIPVKDLVKAANDFTLPLIDVIQPKLAICLGLITFNAIRKSRGLKKTYNMEEAINNPFDFNSTKIFAQAHTGQLGQNNRNKNGINRVSSDWQTMSKYLRS